MNNNMLTRETAEGFLPASAPLANPYVPFQRENPPRYEAKTGMIRGTMYPGLDLPFMGMVNRQELPVTALSELQVLGFALHDLALYLDTHKDDKEAFEVYKGYQKIYHKGMMEYNEQQAPLNHSMPGNRNEYDWLNAPWPWEYPHK